MLRPLDKNAHHDAVATVRTATYLPIFDFPDDSSDVNHIAILLLNNNNENALYNIRPIMPTCSSSSFLMKPWALLTFIYFFSYQMKRYQKLGKFKKITRKELRRDRETPNKISKKLGTYLLPPGI